jgi:hypothetical protein
MTSQVALGSTAAAVTGGRGRGPRGQQATLPHRASRCPIPGCSSRIDSSRLMCRSHWYLVPREVRDQVWATWRSGQAAFSRDHQDAVLRAIAAVLAATGRTPGNRAAGTQR